MMTETPGIEFAGVWKKFHRGEEHDSLRDLVPALARRIAGRGGRRDSLGRQEFWALRDVSFSVAPGEALGIIGPNGAGKSTVLKTLTRILRPDRGFCRLTGRAGALIEIAAGFHPDLTGRENVFLQGAIMGMPTDLIRRRFDEIVEFSGVAQFIDTPVKRYSSGMNARLGFAIAAHLDPDVLIIDEVLAVGDAQFQQRAFERLTSLVRSGLPVVIVSHQLERVAQLCPRCVLLDGGRVALAGATGECIAAYLAGAFQATEESAGGSRVTMRSLDIVGAREVKSGSGVQLRLVGEVLADDERPLDTLFLRVRSAQHGKTVFLTAMPWCGATLPSAGPFELTVDLDMNVSAGIYLFEPYVWSADRKRLASHGPPTSVKVLADERFNGDVQLNPRMRVGPP
jgi:ABC-type polysaccharide/polyol phosphate transport system ATPase subunit